MRAAEARIEADRCLMCYDAPCATACPTHIDVPRFIKQISSRDLVGSATTILEANPLGHSCARVCPVEALCEGACVYVQWHEKPIEIARLQRVATDHLHARRLQPFAAGPDNGKKVAVIGAGPAGLSAAFYLRRLGFRVRVLEKRPLPGGLNTYGIAQYKLDREAAMEEVDLIRDLGVELEHGVEVGADLSLDKLLAGHDAVFVGVGLGATGRLGLAGEDLPGVLDALTYIEHVKSGDFKRIPPGKTTICIGAGNTAVDVVTQAKRLGTPRVVMAYRRGENEKPCYDYEFDLVKHDQVECLWNAAPLRIEGKGRVEAVVFARTETVRGELKAIKGQELRVPCDRVVKAIGQTKQGRLLKKLGLAAEADGRAKVDVKTLRTSNPKVFAGGDAINGGREVVNAAADGKRAALGIYEALFPGQALPPEHRYWASTIEGRHG